jgi:serine/threonine protein kinase
VSTAPPPRHPSSIGHGRYQLLQVLGEGGMATVWRARDTAIGEEIAIKILHPEVAQRKSYRSRFLAEARTMSRIDHPNVLKVFDVGEEEGRYWFTMEVVEGGALIDILEKTGKIEPLQALDVTFQTLQALAAAHLEGVVHRDVKPDNVLLSPDGRARLSDFGIARIRNERVDHRTRTGVSMGTVGYMAPEQRENARGVGPPADLYSVGATLYAMVTGCEPPDLFAAHLDPALVESVPPAIRDVVRTATAYRAEKRYPHARAMAADVAKAYDAIARGKGMEEQGPAWLARFDALILQCARRQAGDRVARNRTPPPARHVDEELPPEPDAIDPQHWPDFEPLVADGPTEDVAPDELRRILNEAAAQVAAEEKQLQQPAPAAAPQGAQRRAPTGLVVALAALVFGFVGAGGWYVVAASRAAACTGVWEGEVRQPSGDALPLRLELTGSALGGVSGTASFGGADVTVKGRCSSGELVLVEQGDETGRYDATVEGDGLVGKSPEGAFRLTRR